MLIKSEILEILYDIKIKGRTGKGRTGKGRTGKGRTGKGRMEKGRSATGTSFAETSGSYGSSYSQLYYPTALYVDSNRSMNIR
ncbi:unnamed protein product [Rotaria sp. Silwood1]|nr:unnamed protein product [Rotaria sp. Silwood1]